jgi:hypothetical protein
MKERAKDAIPPMKAPSVNEIAINGIWLHATEPYVEVWVEVNGAWYAIIREYQSSGGSISHSVSANGILHATEYERPVVYAKDVEQKSHE